jgi:hypothetical protein
LLRLEERVCASTKFDLVGELGQIELSDVERAEVSMALDASLPRIRSAWQELWKRSSSMFVDVAVGLEQRGFELDSNGVLVAPSAEGAEHARVVREVWEDIGRPIIELIRQLDIVNWRAIDSIAPSLSLGHELQLRSVAIAQLLTSIDTGEVERELSLRVAGSEPGSAAEIAQSHLAKKSSLVLSALDALSLDRSRRNIFSGFPSSTLSSDQPIESIRNEIRQLNGQTTSALGGSTVARASGEGRPHLSDATFETSRSGMRSQPAELTWGLSAPVLEPPMMPLPLHAVVDSVQDTEESRRRQSYLDGWARLEMDLLTPLRERWERITQNFVSISHGASSIDLVQEIEEFCRSECNLQAACWEFDLRWMSGRDSAPADVTHSISEGSPSAMRVEFLASRCAAFQINPYRDCGLDWLRNLGIELLRADSTNEQAQKLATEYFVAVLPVFEEHYRAWCDWRKADLHLRAGLALRRASRRMPESTGGPAVRQKVSMEELTSHFADCCRKLRLARLRLVRCNEGLATSAAGVFGLPTEPASAVSLLRPVGAPLNGRCESANRMVHGLERLRAGTSAVLTPALTTLCEDMDRLEFQVSQARLQRLSSPFREEVDHRLSVLIEVGDADLRLSAVLHWRAFARNQLERLFQWQAQSTFEAFDTSDGLPR